MQRKAPQNHLLALLKTIHQKSLSNVFKVILTNFFPFFRFSWIFGPKTDFLCYSYNLRIHRTMPSADLCFQKSSLVSRGKGSLFLLQKAPSVLPLSFFSYEVNGSGALLARFGKKLSVSNQQLKE